jgi:8-amino-7-oxononanoate synthase
MSGVAAVPRPVAVIDALERALERRRVDGLERHRRTLASAQGPRVAVDDADVLAFASNDYLGLAADPAIAAALKDGVDRWGSGAGASPLVCGHFGAHAALEAALARYVAPCADAQAVTFSTGYLANLALLTALAGRDDTVFGDRRNHACLNDGALLSRARFARYRGADLAHLERALAAATRGRRIIATDAVFSMDGDFAPLPALLALAERYDALLVVDDAHGFGVAGDGRGSLAQFGLASARIAYMGTLGKAAGVAGAFVAAHPAVIETLVQTARPYVYTTAAPPALAHALLAALDEIRDGAPRRIRLAQRIAQFRDGARGLPWTLLPSTTAIQPLVVGANDAVVALADALRTRGLWVPAIRPPTVPAGTARLRVSLSAAHTAGDVDSLIAALHDAAGASR